MGISGRRRILRQTVLGSLSWEWGKMSRAAYDFMASMIDGYSEVVSHYFIGYIASVAAPSIGDYSRNFQAVAKAEPSPL